MTNFNALLTRIEKFIVNILLLLVTFILFTNVILRLMGNSLQWAEEFARYGIVWVTFIGSSICVYKGAHIGVDAITMILNKKAKQVLALMTIVVSIVFIVIFIRQSYLITLRAFETGQISSTLKVSMIYIYGAMPVGGVLTLIRLVQEFIKQLKVLNLINSEVKEQ